MKRFGDPLLSLGAPLLILVAIIGLLQRDGRERVESLPALFAGVGLIISGAVERSNHRKKLLMAIRNPKQNENRVDLTEKNS